MINFFFSKSSFSNLDGVVLVLRTLALNVLKQSHIDIAIVEGKRTGEQQLKKYNTIINGKRITFCDGVKNRSKHQVPIDKKDDPNAKAEAFDFVCLIGGKVTYKIKYYYYIVGLMESEARRLGVNIRCGIWFKDKNGKPFEDGGHIEKC